MNDDAIILLAKSPTTVEKIGRISIRRAAPRAGARRRAATRVGVNAECHFNAFRFKLRRASARGDASGVNATLRE